MSKTIPATNIGHTDAEAIAYGFFVHPSNAFKQEVAGLLKKFELELPGVIWPMPVDALHFTLYEVIQPKIYSEDKELLYQRHQREYEELPAKIISSFPPITVNFATIEASPSAIIVRGQDDGSFNKIRAQLLAELPVITESKRPPDIIHSSIARYIQEEDFEKVQAVVKSHSFHFTETVSEVKLLKNLKFPLLEYETLRSYGLGSKVTLP